MTNRQSVLSSDPLSQWHSYIMMNSGEFRWIRSVLVDFASILNKNEFSDHSMHPIPVNSGETRFFDQKCRKHTKKTCELFWKIIENHRNLQVSCQVSPEAKADLEFIIFLMKSYKMCYYGLELWKNNENIQFSWKLTGCLWKNQKMVGDVFLSELMCFGEKKTEKQT